MVPEKNPDDQGLRLFAPTLKVGRFDLVGSSTAGVATGFYLKELSLCFDVANGPSYLVGAKNFLITHGHLDHIGGLPYLLSQRAMMSLPPAQIYLPDGIAPLVEEFLHASQKLEGHPYNYQLTEVGTLGPHQRLKGRYAFQPFATQHVVPSTGYLLVELKKKLKARYQGAAREEILAAKKRGEVVEDQQILPLLAFTGDTQIECFELSPQLKSVRYLMIECSFLDERRSVSEARRWGHIHLNELIEVLPELSCERIFLIHLSQRYSEEEAQALMRKKLPAAEHDRVVVVPRARWMKTSTEKKI